MYSPCTKVTLLNTKLTSTGEHQIFFKSKEGQTQYFLSCPSLSFTNFTFQRKDNVIKIGVNIEQLYSYNYVMYQNTRFTNKYFYAFITKMIYINENLTEVHIKTDCFQTWLFDFTVKKSFVDRQTPFLDSKSTIADSVATGQLIHKKSLHIPFTGGYFAFCSCDVTQDVTTDSTPYHFDVGNYSIPCWVLYWNNTEEESKKMSDTLLAIANHGWGDRILSVVYCPYIGNKDDLKLVNYNSDKIGVINICIGFTTVDSMKSTFELDFNDVVVEHQKALTYPYAKITLTDGATGQTIELAPEKFINNKASFDIYGTISETPTYKIIPKNYKSQGSSPSEALVTKCNTTISTANNLYAKYMMANGEIMSNREVFGAAEMFGSALNVSAKGIVSGFEKMVGISAQENQARKLGRQVTNITDDSMGRLCYNNELIVTLFTMDSDHENMSNNFWKMYGYPVHSLSDVNLSSADDFNFVKLVSPNIEGGNIPSEDMEEIEKIFSNGVTLWHTTEGYRNY